MNVFTLIVSRKYFKLECLEGGQWEETSCEPISCPALPDVFHGMYTCTNGLFYNSVCTLQCPDTSENVKKKKRKCKAVALSIMLRCQFQTSPLHWILLTLAVMLGGKEVLSESKACITENLSQSIKQSVNTLTLRLYSF